MFNKLKEMLVGKSPDFAALVQSGAQVIDVRSAGEFESGHIKGSVNIPLPEIGKQISRIKKNIPVIVCCASGMRSSSAKDILHGKGFDVYNGGGWASLDRKIKIK